MSKFVNSVVTLLFTAGILCIAGCVLPEGVEQYEQEDTSENHCPTIITALPEDNLLTRPVGDEINFIINAEDPDGDRLRIQFFFNDRRVDDYSNDRLLVFHHPYEIDAVDFGENEFLDVRAIIDDGQCILEPLDWTVFLVGG